MGFYHGVTVMFGAEVVTDDPHKTEYHVFDLPQAEEVFKQFNVTHCLAGAADSERVYLYTEHHNLGIGDTFTTPLAAHDDKHALAVERIRACATALGVQIEEPGWITIHEYR